LAAAREFQKLILPVPLKYGTITRPCCTSTGADSLVAL
jgi:hypothetical protein